MRVIAGKYKGHPLQAPRKGTTRPTADKVREAVFSMLGDCAGMRVLDVFAGTGALGIEALSRGADAVTFIERDRAALASLAANLEATVRKTPAADQPGVSVIGSDAKRALERLVRNSAAHDARFDLVFVDPPYRMAESIDSWLGEFLPALLADGGRIVVECDKRQPLKLALEAQESVPPAVERVYGDTLIRIVNLPLGLPLGLRLGENKEP